MGRLMNNMPLLLVALLVVVTAEGADGHDVVARVEGDVADLGEAMSGTKDSVAKQAAEKADIKMAAKMVGVKLPSLTAADKKLAKAELKAANGNALAAAKSAHAKTVAKRAAMTPKDRIKDDAKRDIKKAGGDVLKAIKIARDKEAKRTRKKLKKVAKKGQKQLKKLQKKVMKKQLSEDDVDKMKVDDQVVHWQQEMVREQNAEDKAHMKKAREQVAAQKALIKKRQLGLQKDVSRHNAALKRIDAILDSVDAGILQLAKQRRALHLDFKERARDDMIRAEDEKYKLSLAMKRLPRSLVKPLAKKGDNKAVKKEQRKIEEEAKHRVIVEEERRKLIQEHGAALRDFLPKGTLQTKDDYDMMFRSNQLNPYVAKQSGSLTAR